MANELSYDRGIAVTLRFTLANPSASATTAMTPAGAQTSNVGFVVPTGYAFHAVCMHFESNADLTAGSIIAKVTTGGTVLAGGPQVTLSDTVQSSTAVAAVGTCKVAAAAVVGVKVVADGDYAPTTADLDVILVGLLLPA